MSSFRHPHPNGVLPGGNAFIAGANAAITRSNGLGSYLSKLSDEQIVDLLMYLDGITLGRLARVSKVLYIFSQLESLWRDLVLLRTKGYHINFIRSWRITYAALESPNNIPAPVSPPIKARGFYSEFLFHQWLCCSYDVQKSIPGFFKPDEVPRVSANDLSIEQFIEQYEKPNKPVIITDAVNNWPALSKWNRDYLTKICGENPFRATSASAAIPATFTMKEYIQYAEQTFEESPMYLFDRDIGNVPALREDYAIPDYFSPTAYDALHLPTTKQLHTDLFSVLGEQKRPDHHWLVMGPAKSGSLFHIDPNQTNAWNVCIEGRKKWIFYPPNHSPPGVESSLDGGEVVVPVTTGEWLMTFWSFHQEARYHSNPAMRPLEVITYPGELIFVPNGYWHMVVNLDFCIALTHNYVSTSNLSKVLHFLREKPDQISGLRNAGHDSIQPDDLYQQFVDKLTTVLPQTLIDQHIKESYSSIVSGSKGMVDTVNNKRRRITKSSSAMFSKKKSTNAEPTSSRQCDSDPTNCPSSNAESSSPSQISNLLTNLEAGNLEKSSFSFSFAF